MHTFEYVQKEIDYLKSKVKKLGAAIDKIGMIKLEVTPDPITALVSSIVSQQISGKGAETVWNRLEALLIFSLCRPDVVSFKDLAICRGMMNLYGLKELSREKFERYRKRYSPYGSVASLYLWAISVK